MCPMISDGLIDYDKNAEDSKESGKTLRYIHQCTAPRRRRMWRSKRASYGPIPFKRSVPKTKEEAGNRVSRRASAHTRILPLSSRAGKEIRIPIGYGLVSTTSSDSLPEVTVYCHCMSNKLNSTGPD